MSRLNRQQLIGSWNQEKISKTNIIINAPEETSLLLLKALFYGCSMIEFGSLMILGKGWEYLCVESQEFIRAINSHTKIKSYPNWTSEALKKEKVDLAINLAKNLTTSNKQLQRLFPKIKLIHCGFLENKIFWQLEKKKHKNENVEAMFAINSKNKSGLEVVLAGALIAEIVRLQLPTNQRWSRSELFQPIYFPEFLHIGPQISSFPFPLYHNRLAIIGAGALGNWFLFNLLYDEIQNYLQEIVIVDADVVDITNLNRQVAFNRGDLGKYKATTLAEKVGEKLPGIEIKAYTEQITDENFFKNRNLSNHMIISCVDSWRSRAILNRIAVKKQIPLLNGGSDFSSCNVYGYFPGDSPCLNCAIDLESRATYEINNASCSVVEPSVVFTNMIAAGLMLWCISNPTLSIFGPLQYDISIPERIGLGSTPFFKENCLCSQSRRTLHKRLEKKSVTEKIFQNVVT
jgi:molybdopterin/thiamine biosynthesis adenylyltransferase